MFTRNLAKGLIILVIFPLTCASARADAPGTSASELSAEQEGGTPIQKAEGEVLSAGIGHYSRSRSLLIAAIREFDEGLKVVNPDALLDASRFRADLIDRAKELERVLDPQPRVSRGGVAYQPDSRLIGQSEKKKASTK